MTEGRNCGSRLKHAGWGIGSSLGAIALLVAILSTLGLLPWVTRAEQDRYVAQFQAEQTRLATATEKRLERIDAELKQTNVMLIEIITTLKLRTRNRGIPEKDPW